MPDLELRVTQEQVVDFFRGPARRLAAPDSPLREGEGGHWNFYLAFAVGVKNFSGSVLTAIEKGKAGDTLPGYPEDIPIVPPYEREAKSLYDLCAEELRLFRDIMDDLIKERDVLRKSSDLFELYIQIIQRANGVKKIFESQEVKPKRVLDLVDSINEWIKAKEQMYHPETTEQFLAPYL